MDERKEEMEKILHTLKEKGVDFEEYHHEALDNVLQREEKDLCFDAKICKNLFVTTRKRDRVFLVMVEAHKKADLHRLAQALGTTHLGFAPQELLAERLGQKPGAVGPWVSSTIARERWKWCLTKACARPAGWPCIPASIQPPWCCLLSNWKI